MNKDVKIIENENNVLIQMSLNEIKMMNYRPIKNALMETANNIDKDIVIDMFEINYVDSTFLSVFVEAFKILSRKHLMIKLINVQEPIVDLLKMMNLDKILNISEE